MNKEQLLSAISKKSGLTKANSAKFLNEFINTIKISLKKGEKVTLVGFGTFEVLHRKATTGVNPRTKQKIQIPAKKVAKLRFSDSLNSSFN